MWRSGAVYTRPRSMTLKPCIELGERATVFHVAQEKQSSKGLVLVKYYASIPLSSVRIACPALN